MNVTQAILDAQLRKCGREPAPCVPRRKARRAGDFAKRKAVNREAAVERFAADVAFTVDVRTPNPLNSGGGRSRNRWAIDAERKTVETATLIALRGLKPPALPAVVTLTRISPGKLDAHDALPAALKHVVDEIAQWLGCDDGDEAAVEWVYQQRRERRHAVEVTVKTISRLDHVAGTSAPEQSSRGSSA